MDPGATFSRADSPADPDLRRRAGVPRQGRQPYIRGDAGCARRHSTSDGCRIAGDGVYHIKLSAITHHSYVYTMSRVVGDIKIHLNTGENGDGKKVH